MLVRRIFIFLLAWLLTTHTANAAERQISVAFLAPSVSGNSFWKLSTSFAEAVAEDLGIQLEVIYATDNISRIERLGDKVLTGGKAPDYLLTAYMSAVTPGHLDTARDQNIKVFLINTNIPREDSVKIGTPREQYKNWIAHVSPNEAEAGYLLAEVLINKARASRLVAKSGKIEIVALAGASDTNVAYDRSFGLQRRVNLYNDSILQKIRFSDWEQESAKLDTLDLIEENPGTSAVWAASDTMAFGAIDALKKLDRVAGKDILVGGIDWSLEGIKAVADGRLAATIGGHFMEAGWALILIHDYHHGIDFRDDPGVNFMTSMSVLDSDNAGEYLKKFGSGKWSAIDFKKLSKLYNPKLKKYNLSIDALN
jgi:ABC-type sugar transport system substrate-binding protein